MSPATSYSEGILRTMSYMEKEKKKVATTFSRGNTSMGLKNMESLNMLVTFMREVLKKMFLRGRES